MHNEENYEKYWKLLQDKGLTVGQMLGVRNAFADWANSFPKNVESKNDRKGGASYSSKIPALSGYGFGSVAEVELFNSLHGISPESDKDKLVLVLQLTLKLLDVQTEWTFSSKK